MQTIYLEVPTDGERFYDITPQIDDNLKKSKCDGLLYLFILHTSCALVISENYDPTAKHDLEKFMRYLAPRNLPFIEHTAEGHDDSPSHMKSILLHQHLMLPLKNGKLDIGRWQGVFLAEFRENAHVRKIQMRIIE